MSKRTCTWPSTSSSRWPTSTGVMASDTLEELIAEFDRHWEGEVTRTREVVESIQTI